MTKLTKILTILACTFALSLTIGCGKEGGGDGAGAGGEATLGSIADEMCACTDEACAKTANDKKDAALKALKEKYPKKADVPEDVMKDLEAAEKKYKKCSRELKQTLRAASRAASGRVSGVPQGKNLKLK